MAKVVWSNRAKCQYQGAIAYLSETYGPSQARPLIKKVNEKVALLQRFPGMGKPEKLLNRKRNNIRYIVVYSYKIIYEVMGKRVTLLRFFHCAQHPSRVDFRGAKAS